MLYSFQIGNKQKKFRINNLENSVKMRKNKLRPILRILHFNSPFFGGFLRYFLSSLPTGFLGLLIRSISLHQAAYCVSTCPVQSQIGRFAAKQKAYIR
jgi:hypothetical protein